MKKQLKLEFKILLAVLLPFTIFTTVILVNSYFFTINSIMNEKKLATKALIDSAHGAVEASYKEMPNNPEEAKKIAIREIESLRYGAEGKDYFFILDHNPKMIMHPYSKHLNGKDISNVQDPTGKKLFVEMVKVVKKEGQGFVDYMWAWKGDKNNVVPKISYVKNFKEWNWIIGTGIYVNDVKEQAFNQVLKIFWIALIGFIIFTAIIIYFTRVSIAKPIMRLSKKLMEISSSVLRASTEVSESGQRLAETTAEQASSVEETSASLEELTGMVENNVKSAEESNKISTTVSEVSNKGNTAMQDLIQSMDEISANNENIQKFADVISKIAEKTQIIDEIVFQTKLLSFNASVEAERAGEHGRGFAVVAQEVGNLAQMSGKAALEISNIVKESIVQAQQTAKENKDKVDAGGKLVRETSVLLKEIQDNAISVSVSTDQIVKASREQELGIKQINEAVGILDRAIQVNSTSSEETSESSKELASLVSDLDQTVNGLVNLVSGTSKIDIQSFDEHEDVEYTKPLATPKMSFTSETPTSGPQKSVKKEEKPKQNSGAGEGWDTL